MATIEDLSRLEAEVNELKTEGKLTGFKIYRVEKSIDDLKVVLERLTDVYHNQSMIQKDIVAIFKEISDLKIAQDTAKDMHKPLHAEMVDHMTRVKTILSIASVAVTVLYGAGGWTVNQTLDFAKNTSMKFEELTRQQHNVIADVNTLTTKVGQLYLKRAEGRDEILTELKSLRSEIESIDANRPRK